MFCFAKNQTHPSTDPALFLFYSDPVHQDTETQPLVLKASTLVQKGRPIIPGTLIIHPHAVLVGHLHFDGKYRFLATGRDDEDIVLDFGHMHDTNEVLLDYASTVEMHPKTGPFMNMDAEVGPPVIFKSLDLDLFPSEQTPGSLMVEFWISTLALFYCQVTRALVKWIRTPTTLPPLSSESLTDQQSPAPFFWMWFPDCKPRSLREWFGELLLRDLNVYERRLLVQSSPMAAGMFLVKVRDGEDVVIHVVDTTHTKIPVFKLEQHVNPAFVVASEDAQRSTLARTKLLYRSDFALSFASSKTISDFGFARTPSSQVYLFAYGTNVPLQPTRAEPEKVSFLFATERNAEPGEKADGIREDAILMTKKANIFIETLF